MLWQHLGNAVGNQWRRRRGASIKDEEVTWALRVNVRVKAVLSFSSNLN